MEPGRPVRLRDGTTVRLRPIQPADAGALTALYDRLSPESAYQRFFTVMRRLPPDWARILAAVDHDRREAIVAVSPEDELVGVARYGCEPGSPGSEEAEIALVVQDAWQGRGLGTVLLTALLDHGSSRGLRWFRAYVLATNDRMLRLIEKVGVVTERSLDQGVASLRFTPRPPRPPSEDRPAGTRPADGRS
ncbi:MAG TPA: GNAT family N-acetyltransferase [Methylomirabilota bacterium]